MFVVRSRDLNTCLTTFQSSTVRLSSCTCTPSFQVRPRPVPSQSNTQHDHHPPDLFEKFTSIPIHSAKDAFPRSLRSPTLDLASNHLVCSVALTGVLILQAGRWWAELSDGDDVPYLEEKDAEPTQPAPGTVRLAQH